MLTSFYHQKNILKASLQGFVIYLLAQNQPTASATDFVGNITEDGWDLADRWVTWWDLTTFFYIICFFKYITHSKLFSPFLICRIKEIFGSRNDEAFEMLLSYVPIPHICHRHHRHVCVKKKLPGVNFYRFNAKNWRFSV